MWESIVAHKEKNKTSEKPADGLKTSLDNVQKAKD